MGCPEAQAGLREARPPCLIHGQRDAEIRYQRLSALQENVLWFDVTMDDSIGAGFSECSATISWIRPVIRNPRLAATGLFAINYYLDSGISTGGASRTQEVG